MTAVSTDPSAGLRERKKQRTRDALVEAAFDLFRRKGFEATTVDEIAEAVELSPRTFFRYFESKEDVALTLQDKQFSALYAAFATRPAHEPVITALRHATVAVIRGCEDGTGGVDPDRFSCVQQMMRESPAVYARSLELCTVRLAGLAAHVAARMGAWRQAEPDTPPSVLADRALALLEQGVNYPSA